MRKFAVLGATAAFALSLGACAAPKYMMSNNYLGNDRIAKFSLQPAGSQGDDELVNAYVTVCNLDTQTGTSTQCNETLLLERVVY